MAESLVVSEAVYTTKGGLGQPVSIKDKVMLEDYAHMVSTGSHEWCTAGITDLLEGLSKRVVKGPLMLQHLPAPRAVRGCKRVSVHKKVMMLQEKSQV